jgi:tetratricopeptide (TPR) repeat protein/tRNA A-37 threonylcarbamoyl transferase component Bud32
MARRDETPRDLLFGLLALHTGLIDQDQLLAAFGAWSRARGKTLAEILLERGSIDQESRSLLAAMAQKQLRLHGGDAEKSLASIGAGPSTREKLAALGDADLTSSVGLVGSHTPGQDATATMSVGTATSDGQRFRVLRPHAKGGLGAVFVALDGELNREVALKQILDHHADDPLSRTRFLIEAEITGGLEHPGIVPVYGLGHYGDGRPYYAMRFIRGDSLKDAIATFHADESLKRDPGQKSLALRKLLRRFVDVCNAIDYAHGRGVLHRDLKPGNVIVGKHGETLVVDWGLAKPMGSSKVGPHSDERTLMPSASSGSGETLPGSAIGTPAYMSPEQACGDLERLGPRSDVYSLGATLYCLLTGKAPFEGTDLGAVLRAVQKGAFPRPREVAPSIDRALEAVCLKAMATKPEGRYATARALADDVERWAADEPVSAYRDPVGVRLARWARKHRVGVAIGAGVLQTAVVVLAVSTVLLGQSRAKVESERKRAEAVNAFLIKDLLAQADPENSPAGENLTVREALDKAAKALDTSATMAQTPDVEASIRSTIGNTYYGLGLYHEAITQLERAVALQEQARDYPAAEAIFTANRLAWVIYKAGDNVKGQAMAANLLVKAREALGPDHAETVYAGDSLAAMTVPAEAAFQLFRDNLKTQKRVLGPEHRLTLRAAINLASALTRYRAGDDPTKLAEGLSIYQASREAYQRVLGPDHPETFWEEVGLGFALARSGKFAEAREVLAPLQERAVKVFGPDHLNIGHSSQFLGLAEEGLGHLEAAEKLLLEALEIRRKRLGEGHSQTLETLSHLARVSLALGKARESATYCAEIIRHRGKRDPLKAEAIDALQAMLEGRPRPAPDQVDLGSLSSQLDWLAWKIDWFRAHVSSLLGESWCEKGIVAIPGAFMKAARPAMPVAEARPGGIAKMAGALYALESNPSTPPRILEEDRARVRRWQAPAAPAR